MKLSCRKTAKALGIAEETLVRWIRQGRIPVKANGKECEFDQSMLERWAESHQLTFQTSVTKTPDTNNIENDSLLAAMQQGGVLENIHGQDVESLLNDAVNHMHFIDAAAKSILVETLVDREALNSTGIGKGVAIPHPRAPLNDTGEKATITTCFLKEPMPYQAIDDQPVFVLFIMISPSTQTHLQLLSKLSFCIRDNQFITFLKSRPSEDQLFTKIQAIELGLDREKQD